MKVKTFKAQYELVEFDHYMDHSYEDIINVVDLLLKTNDIDYVKDELEDLFAVDTGKQAYVFSGYQVNECYEIEDGLVKVVCIK